MVVNLFVKILFVSPNKVRVTTKKFFFNIEICDKEKKIKRKKHIPYQW